jgi:hypothetical protein
MDGGPLYDQQTWALNVARRRDVPQDAGRHAQMDRRVQLMPVAELATERMWREFVNTLSPEIQAVIGALYQVRRAARPLRGLPKSTTGRPS